MKKVKPNQYYNDGALEMARFGEEITIDNINSFAAKAEKMSFLHLKCNAISIGF